MDDVERIVVFIDQFKSSQRMAFCQLPKRSPRCALRHLFHQKEVCILLDDVFVAKT